MESLRAQTRPPDRILVCVPARSVREGCTYTLPGWLATPPPGVELVRCATDSGPGTKLLGCMPHVTGDACLIVVDDDMVSSRSSSSAWSTPSGAAATPRSAFTSSGSAGSGAARAPTA